MTHDTGEKQVKALQKEFLIWVEDHPRLSRLDARTFDDVRHRVFRATFQSFRLGVVGLDKARSGIWKNFFGWLDHHPDVRALDPETLIEIGDRCFLTALEAFRIGALVSTTKRGCDEVHDG